MRTMMLTAVLGLVITACEVRAADANLEAKASAWLRKDAVAKDILGMLHAGSTYQGTKQMAVLKVVDTQGREMPGQFAITIRHFWSAEQGSNDHTDVTYFFDALGRFYALRTDRTTAILNQPFALADLGIGLIKDALLDAIKNHPNRQQLEPVIKNANAKGLLELALQIGQP